MRLLPSLPKVMPQPSLTELSASAGASAGVANAARASSHATA
jgi:hypothetical protein